MTETLRLARGRCVGLLLALATPWAAAGPTSWPPSPATCFTKA